MEVSGPTEKQLVWIERNERKKNIMNIYMCKILCTLKSYYCQEHARVGTNYSFDLRSVETESDERLISKSTKPQQ